MTQESDGRDALEQSSEASLPALEEPGPKGMGSVNLNISTKVTRSCLMTGTSNHYIEPAESTPSS